MPNFPPQSTRPLNAARFRRAAAKLRQIADVIEQNAEAASKAEKSRLTRAIFGLAGFSRDLNTRYREFQKKHYSL